jgi:uncharacterized RDD family membrane protein YckC
MSDEFFEVPPESGGGTAAPVWELSGWWRRFGAVWVDYLIVAVPVNVALGVLGVSAEAKLFDIGLPDEINGVSWLATVIVGAIYFVATMTAWNGQTVGKRLAGIRVVRESGAPVTAKFAFARQTLVIALLFNSLLLIPLFIPTALNYLWPLWDENHQALHDKIAESRVVRANPVSGRPGN